MAYAEFDTHRIGLIVNHREERLLPSERLEVVQPAIISIILKRGCPPLRKIIGDTSLWRKIQRAQALERSVKDRIND